MVGITSYGAYVPMLRLSLAAIGGGKPGGPEKAVANWDEDAVTMAIAAAIECLRGVDRASVDGVLFASTSYPFKEKQAAALVARALDHRRDVHRRRRRLAARFDPLRTACDASAPGRRSGSSPARRMAAPRTALEANLGDGAAAFHDDARRARRGPREPTSSSTSGAPRAIRNVVSASSSTMATTTTCATVRALLEDEAAPTDFAKSSCTRPTRSHATVVRIRLRRRRSRSAFGKAGRAPRPSSRPRRRVKAGDRLLVVGYGDGEVPGGDAGRRAEGRRGVAWRARRAPSYDAHSASASCSRPSTTGARRRHLRHEALPRPRRRRDVAGLRAGAAAVQYPRQRVCFRCHARDAFERVRLSDKIGAVVVHVRQLRGQ
jgi:hypothetical protein